MELSEAMTTTGAIREFADLPVSDELLYQIIDDARFAPSGGNRQPWRLIVVKDPALRSGIRDLYAEGWSEYMAHVRVGLVPFAPDEDGLWNGPAVDLSEASKMEFPNSFADNLNNVPVLLLLLVHTSGLACLDNGLGRQSFVGGGSIYPFVHNILLSARSRGVGGVMTTVICRREPQVKDLLGIPSSLSVAGLLAMGHAKKFPKKLSRNRVEEFAYVDSINGEPFRSVGFSSGNKVDP